MNLLKRRTLEGKAERAKKKIERKRNRENRRKFWLGLYNLVTLNWDKL